MAIKSRNRRLVRHRRNKFVHVLARKTCKAVTTNKMIGKPGYKHEYNMKLGLGEISFQLGELNLSGSEGKMTGSYNQSNGPWGYIKKRGIFWQAVNLPQNHIELQSYKLKTLVKRVSFRKILVYAFCAHSFQNIDAIFNCIHKRTLMDLIRSSQTARPLRMGPTHHYLLHATCQKNEDLSLVALCHMCNQSNLSNFWCSSM